MPKKKIVVFGNTIFTKEIIKTIYESNQYEVIAWTSSNYLDKIVNNGEVNEKTNPVEKYCLDNRINLYIPKPFFKEKERIHLLEGLKPDLCIVIAYGRIIPKEFLEIPKFGFINIHGSLLPDLRGATPIQSAILKGYEKTGLTIQKMVYEMDEGDILKNYNVNIDINDNFETLREKMIKVASDDLLNFLDEYFNGNINLTPQDSTKATYCWIKDFTKEKGLIDWNDSAFNIHNKIRSFYPEPISWTRIMIRNEEKKINLISSNFSNIKSIENPGSIFYKDKKLYASTSDFDLELTNLVLEGKKQMSGGDFGNGWVQKNLIKLY